MERFRASAVLSCLCLGAAWAGDAQAPAPAVPSVSRVSITSDMVLTSAWTGAGTPDLLPAKGAKGHNPNAKQMPAGKWSLTIDDKGVASGTLTGKVLRHRVLGCDLTGGTVRLEVTCEGLPDPKIKVVAGAKPPKPRDDILILDGKLMAPYLNMTGTFKCSGGSGRFTLNRARTTMTELVKGSWTGDLSQLGKGLWKENEKTMTIGFNKGVISSLSLPCAMRVDSAAYKWDEKARTAVYALSITPQPKATAKPNDKEPEPIPGSLTCRFNEGFTLMGAYLEVGTLGGGKVSMAPEATGSVSKPTPGTGKTTPKKEDDPSKAD